MIVRIFDSGTGKAKSAINYLLGDKDHAGQKRSVRPEIFDGDPLTTAKIIDGIDRKWKYTSGAIAFRDCEKPSQEKMQSVIEGFEAAFFPGLKKDKNFKILWVLHQDKGNVELHFLTARTELSTGRALNIHPPGRKAMAHFTAWTAVMNQHLGYAQVVPDPLTLSLSGFDMKSPKVKKQTSKMQGIHRVLEHHIRKGNIRNREDLCEFLEERGIEIHRKGKDYISVGVPGRAQHKRFTGAIYSENSDYQKILMESNKARQPKTLNLEEFKNTQANLHALMQERKDFNVKCFLTKKIPRYIRNLEKSEGVSPKIPQTARVGRVFSPISAPKVSTPDSKQPLLEKVTAEKSLPAPTIFQKLISNAPKKSPPSSAGPAPTGGGGQGLILSITGLQAAIDAATADMVTARSPAQAQSAQMKLIALRAQMMKLEMQLRQAKIRELNKFKF